ncbi:MAG: hypothetical protein AAFO94_04180, partial [Bacteroidota bacterium]
MKTSFTLRFLLCLLFISLSANIMAQQFTYNILNNGSDYWVTVTYDSDGACQCNDKYSFLVYKDSYTPSKYLGGKAGSSDKGSFKIARGPGNTTNYKVNMTVTGKNQFIVNCAVDCEASGTGSLRRSTRSLKSPTSVASSNGNDFIKLTWGKGTDVPNANHRYRIAKGTTTNIIATVSGSTREFIDYNVGPGETHTYYIFTNTTSWGGHTSSYRSTTGTTRPRYARATKDKPKEVRISWDDLSGFTDKVTVRRNGAQIGTIEELTAADTVFTDSDPALIPGYAYDYSLTWEKGGESYALNTVGSNQANGRIRGTVKTSLTNLPIADVEVCAVLEGDIDQDAKGARYCDTTDTQGQYDIRRIYYHTEASFRVTPYKENHGFDPGFFENQILDLDNPSLILDFKDTTSFSVSGQVVQVLNGQRCGIKGVGIWLDGVFQSVFTDKDGNYSVTVEETGTYTIEAKLDGHSIEPASQELFVGEDITGVEFEDTQQRTLSGVVEGGCNIYIGQAQLRAYSQGDNGCIDSTFYTDSEGRYSVDLPARPYELEVISLNAEQGLDLDPDAVVSYFNTVDADLTDEDQQRDFVYRRPPQIKVQGLSANEGCDDLAAAIVKQGELYLVDLEVTEVFGDKSCPVEEGFVLVFDEVTGGDSDPDTLHLENGLVTYELIPGTPNIVSPYTKLIEFEAHVGQETSTWKEQILITGVRAREKTFTTVMPEVPTLILHDPPGDASYSYLDRGTEVQSAMRLFGQASGSIKAEGEIKLGTRKEIGEGVSVKNEFWGKVGGSLEVGARIAGQKEWIVTQSFSEQFATSNNEEITGREGDVYVGGAMNLIYAQADVLEVNTSTCSVDKSVDIIMGNDGFNTTFIYTEQHITETLIPQLVGLRNYYNSIQSDSAAVYDNQINVWQQVIDNNRKNKRKAKLEENRSFSAGATYSSTSTATNSSSTSIELSAFVEASVWAAAGFEVAGSGAQGKISATLRVEVGGSRTNSTLNSVTTGFVLNDDDPGDFFSVDIKSDPVYSTPVFELVSGRSSCPHEPGTQPRESLQLLSDSYSQTDIAADGFAAYQLSLGNISQSDEARTYILKFLQESNPGGAVVTIGGSPAVNPIPYTIGPGQQRIATVTVKRGPRAFNY